MEFPEIHLQLYIFYDRFEPSQRPLLVANGSDKVRHAIFDPFLPPSPVTLCHTSRGPPKYVTHLGPPFFSRPSTKTRTKNPCTNSLSIVCRGFCPGGLSGGL